jgi:hypothetical protein
MTALAVNRNRSMAQVSPAAEALASRLEEGARALAELAGSLSAEEWRTPVPKDGRKIGVIVHHVGNMYPIEIDAALTLANGKPLVGVTWDVIHEINAKHAREFAAVTKDEAIAFLERNSTEAAAAIRELTDEQLDRAATVSLNDDAPLTCQFLLEDHAVRHSYHHLAAIRNALASAAQRA